ncbi:hypothetical protein N0V90_008152 [Kalmusia sp. IMI 367209]|nr:hypothetical protein N0V90_008152 [Kalmusia sp. IMI 367209]
MEIDSTQGNEDGEKRKRDTDEDSSPSRSPKRKLVEDIPLPTLSDSATINATMAMAAHVSMKQALQDQIPSPPLHTEREYAAMIPDSPRESQLDFTEWTTDLKFHKNDITDSGSSQPEFERTHGGSIIDFPSQEMSHNGDFYYSPLFENQVRLLRLAPGAWQDPIHCALKPVSLMTLERGELAFQALSYAWGTDSPTETVFLQDVSANVDDTITEDTFEMLANRTRPKSFFVRKNLYQGLRRYRHQKENKWFWIDAICINQANNAEKSRQISFMPAIYSSAYNVAIWLGETDEEGSSVRLAVDLVPKAQL